MSENLTRAPEDVERKTMELDWSEDPIRCPGRDDLPADDPDSVPAITKKAQERALRAVEAELAAGWELDGDAEEAITFERRRRWVLMPTPGMVGPEWEEFCAVSVRLRRGGRVLQGPAKG